VTDDDDQPALRDASSQDGPGIRDLLSLGGMLVGSIVGAGAIGLLVDAWLHSSPVGVLVGTAIGIVLAGVGFWIRVRVYLTGR
jgi:F0F1-type ATP synthase assembly protein I